MKIIKEKYPDHFRGLKEAKIIFLLNFMLKESDEKKNMFLRFKSDDFNKLIQLLKQEITGISKRKNFDINQKKHSLDKKQIERKSVDRIRYNALKNVIPLLTELVVNAERIEFLNSSSSNDKDYDKETIYAKSTVSLAIDKQYIETTAKLMIKHDEEIMNNPRIRYSDAMRSYYYLIRTKHRTNREAVEETFRIFYPGNSKLKYGGFLKQLNKKVKTQK